MFNGVATKRNYRNKNIQQKEKHKIFSTGVVCRIRYKEKYVRRIKKQKMQRII